MFVWGRYNFSHFCTGGQSNCIGGQNKKNEVSQNAKKLLQEDGLKYSKKCLNSSYLLLLYPGIIIIQVYDLVIPLWRLVGVWIERRWICLSSIGKNLEKYCHFLIKLKLCLKLHSLKWASYQLKLVKNWIHEIIFLKKYFFFLISQYMWLVPQYRKTHK